MASKYDKYRDEWADLWLYEGLTTRKIAEQYNCSRPTVTHQLKQTRLKEFKARCYYRAEEVEKLYVDEGWGLEALGERCHCSPAMVRQLLRERGHDTSTRRSRNRGVPAEDRFWGYVNRNGGHGPDGECWLWTGARSTDVGGKKWHGVFHDNGYALAHRFSYELHSGPIPDGLQVNHHCDVPHCVNPDHLYTGTQKENMADKVRRDRQARGSRHPNASIDEEIAEQIAALKQEDLTAAQVAVRFEDATAAIVRQIWRGKTWSHVTNTSG